MEKKYKTKGKGKLKDDLAFEPFQVKIVEFDPSKKWSDAFFETGAKSWKEELKTHCHEPENILIVFKKQMGFAPTSLKVYQQKDQEIKETAHSSKHWSFKLKELCSNKNLKSFYLWDPNKAFQQAMQDKDIKKKIKSCLEDAKIIEKKVKKVSEIDQKPQSPQTGNKKKKRTYSNNKRTDGVNKNITTDSSQPQNRVNNITNLKNKFENGTVQASSSIDKTKAVLGALIYASISDKAIEDAIKDHASEADIHAVKKQVKKHLIGLKNAYGIRITLSDMKVNRRKKNKDTESSLLLHNDMSIEDSDYNTFTESVMLNSSSKVDAVEVNETELKMIVGSLVCVELTKQTIKIEANKAGLESKTIIGKLVELVENGVRLTGLFDDEHNKKFERTKSFFENLLKKNNNSQEIKQSSPKEKNQPPINKNSLLNDDNFDSEQKDAENCFIGDLNQSGNSNEIISNEVDIINEEEINFDSSDDNDNTKEEKPDNLNQKFNLFEDEVNGSPNRLPTNNDPFLKLHLALYKQTKQRELFIRKKMLWKALFKFSQGMIRLPHEFMKALWPQLWHLLFAAFSLGINEVRRASISHITSCFNAYLNQIPSAPYPVTFEDDNKFLFNINRVNSRLENCKMQFMVTDNIVFGMINSLPVVYITFGSMYYISKGVSLLPGLINQCRGRKKEKKVGDLSVLLKQTDEQKLPGGLETKSKQSRMGKTVNFCRGVFSAATLGCLAGVYSLVSGVLTFDPRQELTSTSVDSQNCNGFFTNLTQPIACKNFTSTFEKTRNYMKLIEKKAIKPVVDGIKNAVIKENNNIANHQNLVSNSGNVQFVYGVIVFLGIGIIFLLLLKICMEALFSSSVLNCSSSFFASSNRKEKPKNKASKNEEGAEQNSIVTSDSEVEEKGSEFSDDDDFNSRYIK